MNFHVSRSRLHPNDELRIASINIKQMGRYFGHDTPVQSREKLFRH